MLEKFCVIGLGRFGYHVATTLALHGHEVLAVDSNDGIIHSIRDHVTQAICMQVTDEESLRAIGIAGFDTVIVAVGENFAQSVLITALLKHKLHIRTVLVRSVSPIHHDILELIGADEIISPERQVAMRLAERLCFHLQTFSRITDTIGVGVLPVPERFVGRTVAEADLQNYYGVTLLGKKDGVEITQLMSTYTFEEHDTIVCMGTDKNLEKLGRM